MFEKILIANRGEIACRIMRSARNMGLSTVAVYSAVDRNAPHVQMADEAVCIGDPQPARSYLVGEKILQAAKQSGAQAIHPGYGFLSENADFCELCTENGLVFIGPPASAIRAMGSKSVAKQIMEGAGVPLVPGYHGDEQQAELLLEKAEAIGYPVLLKAVAGGGGKGMRQVWAAQEFMEGLVAAQREAKASFGDDRMLVEKFLVGPRHVEIQVFSDSQGNGVYLSERDCSIQRRHQKIIEEAPAPGVSDELREQMGRAAVDAAQAIDYVGAGTVEFLLDQDGSFYFMEMNTRLQVEHPVTEMVTSLDLVEWQLRVAAGERLPLTQDQVQVHGHAIEARIYAEDPANEFLPSSGAVRLLVQSPERDWLRIDSGVRQGDEVSVYYDPMIAKLIVWGEERGVAVARLKRALAEYHLAGMVTNTEFLRRVAGSSEFVEGKYDTNYVEDNLEHLLVVESGDEPDDSKAEELAMAAIFLQMVQENSYGTVQRRSGDPWSPWCRAGGWRMNEPDLWTLELEEGTERYRLTVEQRGEERIVKIGTQSFRGRGRLTGNRFEVELDNRLFTAYADYRVEMGELTLFLPDSSLHCRVVKRDYLEADLGDGSGRPGFGAPMNGTIVALMAEPGDNVGKGETLLVMEAMKMEHAIRAPAAGTVLEFFCQVGELVEGGAELLAFKEDATS